MNAIAHRLHWGRRTRLAALPWCFLLSLLLVGADVPASNESHHDDEASATAALTAPLLPEGSAEAPAAQVTQASASDAVALGDSDVSVPASALASAAASPAVPAAASNAVTVSDDLPVAAMSDAIPVSDDVSMPASSASPTAASPVDGSVDFVAASAADPVALAPARAKAAEDAAGIGKDADAGLPAADPDIGMPPETSNVAEASGKNTYESAENAAESSDVVVPRVRYSDNAADSGVSAVGFEDHNEVVADGVALRSADALWPNASYDSVVASNASFGRAGDVSDNSAAEATYSSSGGISPAKLGLHSNESPDAASTRADAANDTSRKSLGDSVGMEDQDATRPTTQVIRAVDTDAFQSANGVASVGDLDQAVDKGGESTSSSVNSKTSAADSGFEASPQADSGMGDDTDMWPTDLTTAVAFESNAALAVTTTAISEEIGRSDPVTLTTTIVAPVEELSPPPSSPLLATSAVAETRPTTSKAFSAERGGGSKGAAADAVSGRLFAEMDASGDGALQPDELRRYLEKKKQLADETRTSDKNLSDADDKKNGVAESAQGIQNKVPLIFGCIAGLLWLVSSAALCSWGRPGRSGRGRSQREFHAPQQEMLLRGAPPARSAEATRTRYQPLEQEDPESGRLGGRIGYHAEAWRSPTRVPAGSAAQAPPPPPPHRAAAASRVPRPPPSRGGHAATSGVVDHMLDF